VYRDIGFLHKASTHNNSGVSVTGLNMHWCALKPSYQHNRCRQI